MGTHGGKFAQLGGDDVIRFLDTDQFLAELGGNLGRGRAIVRSRRSFKLEDRLKIEIEAPNVTWTVACDARVVVVRDGFLGLELLEFEDHILPKLEDLGLQAQQNLAQPPAEKTVIAPMPTRPESFDPAEEKTGDLPLPTVTVPAEPACEPAPEPVVEPLAAVEPEPTPPTPAPAARPALGGRRRRPRPLAKAEPLKTQVEPEPRNLLSEPTVESPPAAVHLEVPSRDQVADSEDELPAQADEAGTSQADSDKVDETPATPPPHTPSATEEQADLPPRNAPAKRLPRARSAVTSDLTGTPPPMLAQEDLLIADLGSNPLLTAANVVETASGPREASATKTITAHLPVAGSKPLVPRSASKTAVADVKALHFDVPPEPLPDETALHGDIEQDDLLSMGSIPDDDFEAPQDDLQAPEPEDPEKAAQDNVPNDSDDSELVLGDVPDFDGDDDELVLGEVPDFTGDDDELADSAGDDVPDGQEQPDEQGTPNRQDAEPPPVNDALKQESQGPQDRSAESDANESEAKEPEAKEPEPEPEPSVPVQNIEALDGRHPALPRVTRGGVLRVSDTSSLLGLYLSQVRHGRLTVLGALQGDPGDAVNLKIVGPTVVSLPATIEARVGEWVTLSIPSAEPLQEVLRDTVDEWSKDLPVQAAPRVATPAAIAPAPPVVTPPAAPVVTPPAPPVVTPAAPEPVVAPAAPDPVVTPAAPEPEPEPEDDLPPEMAKLAGNNVVFRRRKDLAHEIAQNLKNGGLFVEAPPMAIRTKRQFNVQVGSKSWQVMLQADVVFADAGRVGFSVINAAEAVGQLQDKLDGVAPVAKKPFKSSPPNQPDAPAAAPPSQAPAPTADLQTPPSANTDAYIGSLSAPLNNQALLTLIDKRISDISTVIKSSAMQLFDYFIAHRFKGVLKLRCRDSEVITWFHEGSVAFVTATPSDETHSVGRILIAARKLNETGLREALQNSKQFKRSMGRSLVSLGLIKKSDLSAALREQMRSKLGLALDFESGDFEWTPWREPPGNADLVLAKGVGVLAQVLRQRFDNLNVQQLEALLGKNMARPVGHDSDLDQSTQGLHLQPRELRFLELQLDGQAKLQDALRGSPVGHLASLRLVTLGLALGFLHFTQGGRAPREATRIGVAPSRFDAVSMSLQEQLHSYSTMNHFEILEVHWSAHHRTYREAYDRVRRQFDPKGKGIKDAPREVKDLAHKVLEVLETSFKVLTNTTQRTEYRRQLLDKTEREYSADMLVKQGEVALMRGDRVDAIEALETAVELNPTRRSQQLLISTRQGRK